jgi:hypothetical protein
MEYSFQIGLAIGITDIVEGSDVQGCKVIAVFLRTPGGAHHNHGYLNGLAS